MRQMAHSIQDAANNRCADRKRLECISSHGSHGSMVRKVRRTRFASARTVRATNPKQ
jgi:hypothetical protein